MDIQTYLTEKKLTDGEFSSLVGCDRSIITKMRQGKPRKSDDLLRKIVAASNGKITLNDLLGIDKAGNPLSVSQ